LKAYKGVKFYKVPYQYSDYDMCGFYEWDMEQFAKLGAEKVVYYYGTGDYCGGGEAMIRRNNKWYRANFSHCSCYGPTEHLDSELMAKPFNLNRITPELRSELKPILDYMKRYGIK